MTAIRSASWSASSRYCVVRSTVVPAGGEAADNVPDLVAAARIEPGGRLVQEEQVRRDDDRGRDVEPPPQAAGVGLGLLMGRLGEAERAEQLPGSPVARPRVQDPRRRAMRIRFSRPVRSSSTAANCPVRLDPAPHRVGLAHHVVAEDPRFASVRSQQGRQHPNQRRLARAVRTEDAEDLARRRSEDRLRPRRPSRRIAASVLSFQPPASRVALSSDVRGPVFRSAPCC